MKRSTLGWIAGSLAAFFIIILILMYMTMQPSDEYTSVENVFTEYMFPNHIKKHISIQLGPISLFLLRKAIQTTSWMGNLEYDPSTFLEDISAGEFGIYEVNSQDAQSRMSISHKLRDKLTIEGWNRFLTVRDHSSSVEGFVKSGDKLEGLFIYVLDASDLLIINIGTGNGAEY